MELMIVLLVVAGIIGVLGFLFKLAKYALMALLGAVIFGSIGFFFNEILGFIGILAGFGAGVNAAMKESIPVKQKASAKWFLDVFKIILMLIGLSK